MAPSKKCKTNNKIKDKEQKLTDMLGPQWSKIEIERFYYAYRKYGQDWKKVADIVHSKSAEMVEALYKMHPGYLSLPEGVASVEGLIAIMTDKDVDGTGNEKESKEPEVMSRKIQKNSKAKSLVDDSRENIKCILPHFPVRKRTPRVIVACLDNNPNKKPRISVTNANGEGIFHGDSMLPKEWNISNSPLDVQTCKNIELMKIAKDLENSPSRGLKIKHGGYAADEKFKDGNSGCKMARKGTLPKQAVNTSAIVRYKKGNKEEFQPSEATSYDNIQEAYPYGDEGARRNCFDGRSVKICTSEGQRKKIKKPTHKDELAACGALHALAEMSSMMSFLDAEHVENDGESTVRLDDVADRVLSDVIDVNVIGESQKKRMKSMADEEVKSADGSEQIFAISKRCYSSLRSRDPSSSNDPHTGELEVAVSSAQDHTASEYINFTRRKKKRKRDRTLLVKDIYSITNGSLESDGSLSVLQDQLLDVKAKLSHCLSWHGVRKWCIYEWFYSAIDYPWFAKRDFEEYLNHVGLGHISRLTRSELGVIRSSLGRPRRFSEHFIQEEREKLKRYRESVRTHYTNVRAGLGGLPPDLACPLYVGQQVVAIHPKTREFYNGSVLTVDHDSCRVQFHHPDLGLELIMDIDCMPLNPLENIPEAMRRQKRPFDYHCVQHPKVSGAISSALGHMKNADHNLCVPPLSPANAIDIKVLDQHSTDPENLPPLHLQIRDAVGRNGTMPSSNNSYFGCDEIASNVTEIVEGSREKAQIMVDTAVKAISIIKEDEDAFARIIEALDANCKAECATNGRPSMTMNSNTIPLANPVVFCNSVPQLTSDSKSDLEIPSELITSCVSTLLVIQTCTERQYPPEDVAQMLNKAATRLRPCCPQNLSIYREIQMCMGRIKVQTLALVPT